MRRFLTAVSLVFLLSLGWGVEPARSANATFKVTNSAPNIIHVKLFSQSRHGWQSAHDAHHRLPAPPVVPATRRRRPGRGRAFVADRQCFLPAVADA